MAAGSAAAAVFTVWCRRIAQRALEPRLGPDLFRRYHASREPFQCLALPAWLEDGDGTWVDAELLGAALDDALEELRAALGEDIAGWRWGALHHVRLAAPLASIPGLDALFVAADTEVGGDEQTVMQGGFDGRLGYAAAVIPSWRAVYDLADLDRSMGVLPAGVSGNPASPHWGDQHELWAGGRAHPLPFTEAAVDAATVSALQLIPGTISG
jgi:penicillin amidase